jgi:iron(II)-dependent oxidoreductase
MPATRAPSTLEPMSVEYLWGIVTSANSRSLSLVKDLDEYHLIGPRRRILTPPLWIFGHIAWLYDRYLLRPSGSRPRNLPEMDNLFDDLSNSHQALWELGIPGRDALVSYSLKVIDAIPAALGDGPLASPEVTFLCRMCVQREDMLAENLISQRQTLGLQPPDFLGFDPPEVDRVKSGDLHIPGGVHSLGAVPEDPFYLDNEKWGHGYEVKPFSISRFPVTNSEFCDFIEDDGYQREELWSRAGWGWRCYAKASHPIYWRHDSGRWERRSFQCWQPLREGHPVDHISWFEADAWCRWAGRRLPWEGEWEIAASLKPRAPDKIQGPKNRYPWGDETWSQNLANLDCQASGPCSVYAYEAGDSGYGVRQMVGNVWEWTQSVLSDYPGYSPDVMAHLSRPFMDGTHPVLRGGSWATRPRAVWNTFRHFASLDRRDFFSGFRTCAL